MIKLKYRPMGKTNYSNFKSWLLPAIVGVIMMFDLWKLLKLNLIIGFLIGCTIGFCEVYFDERYHQYGKVVAVTSYKGQGIDIVDLEALKNRTEREERLASRFNFLSVSIMSISLFALMIGIFILIDSL